MRVFIVVAQEDTTSDCWVHKVFSSREKALIYLGKLSTSSSLTATGEPFGWKEETRHGTYYYHLESWPVDAEEN